MPLFAALGVDKCNVEDSADLDVLTRQQGLLAFSSGVNGLITNSALKADEGS